MEPHRLVELRPEDDREAHPLSIVAVANGGQEFRLSFALSADGHITIDCTQIRVGNHMTRH
jgi:hypothetical protein